MKVLFFANTDWYLYNFRLPLAHFLKEQGIEVVLVSPPGQYGNTLKELGFKWIPLQMNRRGLNPRKELILIANIRKLLKQEKPDILHSFTIKCVVYGVIAARLAGINSRVNAVTGMGYVFTNRQMMARVLRPIVWLLLKFSLKGKTSRLILQNKDDITSFIDTGLISLQKVRLIRGSGVNTKTFSPDPKINNSNTPFRILLASRLLWDKGIREYIEASQQVKALGLKVEFLLAGDIDEGNPASVPQTIIDEWREQGYVKFLGHVDNMKELLRQVNLVVLPSYREGVPKSLIEAASAGLPIITTDATGCREIVKHGVNGLLIPIKDSKALATAICILIEDPLRAKQMGEAGRKLVLAEFDEQIVFTKTLAVYKEIHHLANPSDVT